MSLKFKYGNYEFKRNPSSFDRDLSYVGDNPVTLSGRVIIQPSFYKVKSTIDSVFWQPSERILETVNINDDVICYNSNCFYTYNLITNELRCYDKNFCFIKSINLSPLGIVAVNGITCLGDYVYLNIKNNNNDYMFYKINKNFDGSVANLYSTDELIDDTTLLDDSYIIDDTSEAAGIILDYILCITPIINTEIDEKSSDNNIKSLTNNGTNLYYIDDNNNIKLYNFSTNTNEIIFRLISDDQLNSLIYIDGYFGANLPSKNIFYIFDNNGFMFDVINTSNVGIIKSACVVDKNNLYVINQDNVCKHFRINTVALDVNNLVKQVNSGKITLRDHYGRTQKYIVTNIKKTRIEKYQKAYRISLNIEGAVH